MPIKQFQASHKYENRQTTVLSLEIFPPLTRGSGLTIVLNLAPELLCR